MKKYPSIEQFRNIIRTVKSQHDFQGKDEEGNAIYQHLSDYPKLSFTGTVKLHGTNAGIVKYKDKIQFQSRERVLSLERDNAGFMLAMSGKPYQDLFEGIQFNDYVAVYGEWCGANIQKNVALQELPKMFVIFGCKVDDKWIEFDLKNKQFWNSINVFSIDQFPTFKVDINFNSPEEIQNQLIDLTIAVEDKCPVGEYFGVTGIGEGIVFTCDTNPELKFKSKGEKHSSSKVKTLNAVNVEELESVKEFVEYACTENRMRQGLDYLIEQGLEVHQKSTGQFLSWLISDIIKEESDTIVRNQVNIKKAKAEIAIKAKAWFFNHF